MTSSRRSSRSINKKLHKKNSTDDKINLINSPPPAISSSQTIGSSSGGFLSSVTQGLGFGIGSSIGHRVIGGIFGSNNNTKPLNNNESTPLNEKVSDITSLNYISKNECKNLHEEYLNCVNDVSSYKNCDSLLNIFKQCEDNKY